MIRVLVLGFCVRVRVSVTGVSYLNKKFVVVLAFVARLSSVDHNVLTRGSLWIAGYRDAIHDDEITTQL